ncbi:MAG: tripartite tricarboxylate transporter permease [Aquisalimonadaceae bacterium]
MELIGLDTILGAISVVSQPSVLMWMCIGVAVGLIFGASPGLTATTGVAIAVPLTFGVNFEQSMALLLGLYCAGYFAGSLPAILINTPGAPGNAATALDGYRLARSGKADLAISLSATASVVGGIFSIIVLMFAAPQLSSFALKFTSVEYCVLGLFGVSCVAAVSGGSMAKGIIGASFGMLLATIGIDEVGGVTRFTMGMPALLGGIPLIPALIAMFALAELFTQAANPRSDQALPGQQRYPLAGLPRFLGKHWALLGQSAMIGTFIGILPGAGPTIASWIAYGQARGRERAGESDEDAQARGVMAAESANNAVTGGALVPLLTLGIPGDTVTAVLIGALLIQGIDPGPMFIFEHEDLFAQILVILLFSSVLFLVITLLARGLLPRIVTIPPRILLPIVAVLCATGGFAINNATFEVGLIAVLGMIGYVLLRFGVSMAPVVLGLVLGPIIEVNMRNALIANDMDFTVFFTRPISATLLAVLAVTLVVAGWRSFHKR